MIHSMLKEKVKGKITTNIYNGTLIITIQMDELIFKNSFENFCDRICFVELSLKDVVDETIGKYRKFLLNRLERYYFKKEESK